MQVDSEALGGGVGDLFFGGKSFAAIWGVTWNLSDSQNVAMVGKFEQLEVCISDHGVRSFS